MAIVSRLELNHPALGTAGGVALHDSIEALYQKIGDALSSRWYSIADFDQSQTVELNHNFTTDISNLSYDLYNFTGGEWVKVTADTTPALSDFTIIEKVGDESDVLEITNNTGGDNLVFAISVVFDPIHLSDGDVKDVDISSIADKQVLVYDLATKKFLPSDSLENKTLQNLTYGLESGAAAATISPTKAIFKITSGTEIEMIDPAGTKVITLMNVSGAAVTLKNLTGATSANQIITGTGGDITINNDSSIVLEYDTVSSKFRVVGGTGSGGGLENVFVNAASSPVTGEIGKFYFVDTTAGSVIINQPEISTIPANQFPFATMMWADVKGTFDTNSLFVNAAGSDVQNYPNGLQDTSYECNIRGSTNGLAAISGTEWAMFHAPQGSLVTGATATGEGGVNFFENGRFTDDLGLDFWSKTGGFSSLSLATGASALEGDNSLTFTNTTPGDGILSGELAVADQVYRGYLAGFSFSIKIVGTGTYTYRLKDSVTLDVLADSVGTITGTAAGDIQRIFKGVVIPLTTNALVFELLDTGSGVAADAITVDLFKLDPNGEGVSFADSDWADYTPTGSWTATYTGKWRKDGGDILLKIGLTLAGAPAGSLNFTTTQLLNGLGLTYDNTRNATNANKMPWGQWHGADTGVQDYGGSATPSDATAAIPTVFLYYGSTALASVSATAPFTWGAGDKIGIELRLPITEWRNAVNPILDNGQIYQSYSGQWNLLAAAITTTLADIRFTAKEYEDGGTFYDTATGIFTAPATLRYKFVVNLNLGAGPTFVSISVTDTSNVVIKSAQSAPNDITCEFTVSLNAGQQVKLRGVVGTSASTNNTATTCYLTIKADTKSSANQLVGAGTSLLSNGTPTALLPIIYDSQGEGDLGSITGWATVDSKKYRWYVIGKILFFESRIESATPSSSVTSLTFTIPSSVPKPKFFSSQNANEFVCNINGSARTTVTSGVAINTTDIYFNGTDYTINTYLSVAQSSRLWMVSGFWQIN